MWCPDGRATGRRGASLGLTTHHEDAPPLAVSPVIQAWTRRYIAQRALQEEATRRVRCALRLFVWRRRTREGIGWRKAARYRDRRLLSSSTFRWRELVAAGRADARALGESADALFERALVRTHWRAWVRAMAPSKAREESANAAADEWRSRKRTEALFELWRENTRRIARRRTRSIEALVFMLPLGFENSSRQQRRSRKALAFHRRHALRRAWEAFLSLNTRLAKLRRSFKVANARRCRCLAIETDSDPGQSAARTPGGALPDWCARAWAFFIPTTCSSDVLDSDHEGTSQPER